MKIFIYFGNRRIVNFLSTREKFFKKSPRSNIKFDDTSSRLFMSWIVSENLKRKFTDDFLERVKDSLLWDSNTVKPGRYYAFSFANQLLFSFFFFFLLSTSHFQRPRESFLFFFILVTRCFCAWRFLRPIFFFKNVHVISLVTHANNCIDTNVFDPLAATVGNVS